MALEIRAPYGIYITSLDSHIGKTEKCACGMYVKLTHVLIMCVLQAV